MVFNEEHNIKALAVLFHPLPDPHSTGAWIRIRKEYIE
jgi:hypothetical protein